jgi:hypothetical protein
LEDVARRCFAFCRCLVFITWASRGTPDVALPEGDSGNGVLLAGLSVGSLPFHWTPMGV